MDASSGKAFFQSEFKRLVRAQVPLLHVNTFEESRALEAILEDCAELGRHVLLWSTTKGVTNPNVEQGHKGKSIPNADLVGAIQAFEQSMSNKVASDDGMLFLLLDPYPYLSDKNSNPIYRRKLRDLAFEIRDNGWKATCVIVAPSLNVPYELEKEVTILDFPLPTRPEIKHYIRHFVKEVMKNGNVEVLGDVDTIVELFTEAAIGLSQRELENALSYATIDDLKLDASDVRQMFRQKSQTVRKSGLLEFASTDGLSLNGVGGMERLKTWLGRRRAALSDAGQSFGLPLPRGVLLTGIPGCGKSLSAKSVAASWNLPLLRLDMGRVFASLVGASEEHMRHAIQIAEAVAPCVLWIDEIEKGLVRPGQHIGDSGVSMRVLGTFLTWMQEKTSSVFVVATANDIGQLPPEMLRKGRFDGVFFVDLPTDAERLDILRIHLERVGQVDADLDVRSLVEMSGAGDGGLGMTGAEIAAWVDDAMLLAFEDTQSSKGPGEAGLSMNHFEIAFRELSLLGAIRPADIDGLREWGRTHAQPATE